MKDLTNQLVIGQVINKKHESRDPFDIIFKVIDVTSDTVKCTLACDLPYRVIYHENNVDLYAVDPSGGPFMAVGSYELIPDVILESIRFIEGNQTECIFKVK